MNKKLSLESKDKMFRVEICLRLRDLRFKTVTRVLTGTLEECFAEGDKFIAEFLSFFDKCDIESSTSYVKNVRSIASQFFTIPNRTDFLLISYYEGSD